MAVKKWVGGTASFTTDANTTTNYSPVGVPTTGDDLYIDAGTGTIYSITTSLSALSAVTLNSLNISQSYTGSIGLSSAYLQVSATTVNIGQQFGGATVGNGSPLIRLNLGTVTSTVNIYNTAKTSALAGAGPVTILGTHTSSTLNVMNGIVSVAVDPLESSTFNTVNNSGTLYFGPSVTLSVINANAGSTTIRSACGTVNLTGGSLLTAGSGTLGLLQAYSGTASLLSNGTISTINIYGASVDMSGDPRAKTVTNCTIYSGSLNADTGVKGSVTFTNPITIRASAGRFSLSLPQGITLAPA